MWVRSEGGEAKLKATRFVAKQYDFYLLNLLKKQQYQVNTFFRVPANVSQKPDAHKLHNTNKY